MDSRHWAYLRVSEGCNQNCAFCTIPSIRGKMRSKPLDKIISEAESLMASGAFELNLIGQDTTSYGMDIGEDGGLVAMLTALDGVAAGNGGGWIRLMYAYPSNFTDGFRSLAGVSGRMNPASRLGFSFDHHQAILKCVRDVDHNEPATTSFIPRTSRRG
ncbi:MAG: radical SAM protein [Actinomycetales bacterium]|nr:radical SAM protein [Actinomycetales bacterium]